MSLKQDPKLYVTLLTLLLPLLLPLLLLLVVQNLELVNAVKAMADRKGCTASQLALAWVHAQGEDVFTIPGTKRVK